MKTSAVISDCGRYRYRLERDFETENRRAVVFIMVNPSTADAENDDATIRRCIGFTERLGYGRLIVGNKFAYRATDIKALHTLTMSEAVGPENDQHLMQMAREAGLVIFGWGPLGKIPKRLQPRWKQVYHMVRSVARVPYVLGTAKDGHPRHPLMLRNDALLEQWFPPFESNRLLHELRTTGVNARDE